MARIFNNIVETVGGTPLVRLNRVTAGLEATILVANKIALGQIDAGIGGGVDTTSDAPLAINEDLREILLDPVPEEFEALAESGARLCPVAALRTVRPG